MPTQQATKNGGREVHETIPKNTPLRPLESSHLSILSYNVLAPVFVRPLDLRTGRVQEFASYKWAEPADEVLDWSVRRPRILQELVNSQSDVICLQEVQFDPIVHDETTDGGVHQRTFEGGSDGKSSGAIPATFRLPDWLRLDGYDHRVPSSSHLAEMAQRNLKVLGVPIPTGNAVLWRSDRLKLAERTKHNRQSTTRVSVCLQSSNSSTLRLPPTSFSSVHLDATDIAKRSKQMLQCIATARDTYGVRDVVIAGDMNSQFEIGSVLSRFDSTSAEPTSEQIAEECRRAYRIEGSMTDDDLAKAEADEGGSSDLTEPPVRPLSPERLGEWERLHDEVTSALRESRMSLTRAPTGPTRSGYGHGRDEGPCVSWNIDHILYSNHTLRLRHLWSTLEDDQDSLRRGLPNANCPSDHLPVAATFEPVSPPSLSPEESEQLAFRLSSIEAGQAEAWWQLESTLDSELPLTVVDDSGGRKGKKKTKPPPETVRQMQERKRRERELKSVQREERRGFVDGMDFNLLVKLDELLLEGGSGGGKSFLRKGEMGQAPATVWAEHGPGFNR